MVFSKFVARSAPAPIAMPTPTAEIKSYAPDTAPAGDSTKVILVVQNFTEVADSQYSCMIDGTEVPVKVTLHSSIFSGQQIAPGVLEFQTPIHTAGVVQFYLMCKGQKNKNVQNVQYSNAVFFYFTPSDETGNYEMCSSYFFLSTVVFGVQQFTKRFRYEGDALTFQTHREGVRHIQQHANGIGFPDRILSITHSSVRQ